MFEELDDAEVISVIQFWERVASAAAAAQLAAIAELARRRPRSYLDDRPGHVDRGDPGAPEVSEFAVDEIAAALRLSRPAAGARLHVAVELSRLPAVSIALSSGVLDVPKTRAVVDAVTPLDAPTATAVVERVLPRAGRQTVGQLRASLARAVLAADPAAAEARHERAVASRQVTVRAARDGMAELWALLPADAAVAVYGRVDAIAREEAPDDRGMDARRADALVTAVLGAPQPIAASVHVTVPVETAVGVGDQPGGLAGYGPIPGSMARRLAAGAAAAGHRDRAAQSSSVGAAAGKTAAASDPVSVRPCASASQRTAVSQVAAVGATAYTPSAALADLVRVRDVTCRFPGCRQPAARCDLDHVVPWPTGPTTAANLAALCRHHHRMKHQTEWSVRTGPGAELVWTAPSSHTYVSNPPYPAEQEPHRRMLRMIRPTGAVAAG
jgi:Domain of unknown function (DUF222)/HNH endonuclease